MMKRTITLVALALALVGCGAQSHQRANTASHAFAALNCGAAGGTYRPGVGCLRRPLPAVCVCTTDYDCALTCGGEY